MGMSTLKYVDNPLFTVTTVAQYGPWRGRDIETLPTLLGVCDGNPPAIGGFSL